MSTRPSAPPVSVVIPTRDTRELTLRCLASLDRAAPEAEVVVVDDASADGTAEAIAAAHPRVQVVRSCAPAGFTRAANRGLAMTGSELLLLLNSDTEVEPGGLSALRLAFATEPRLGAAGAALHYPDGSPQWSGGREPTLPWLFALASGVPELLARLPLYRRLKSPGARPGDRGVEWVSGAAMALRRAAWLEAGPFDEGFRFYGQDLDLCSALRSRGWTVALLPAFRVLHHHGATIGRRTGAMARQDAELLWSDLLRWAAKRRGAAWARRAGAALTAGGRLRLCSRALALPFLPPARRAARRQRDLSLRRAIAAAGRQP